MQGDAHCSLADAKPRGCFRDRRAIERCALQHLALTDGQQIQRMRDVGSGVDPGLLRGEQVGGGVAGVNARDRIGKGPWHNAKGVVVAKDVEDLHSNSSNINKQTALTEKGETVSGRGDAVNMHDVLTGSDPQGLYSTAGGDTTCGNWTKSTADGSAIVGHHDRTGLKDTRHMNSWNSAHGSRGCGQDNLKGTGGAGLFYCFLAN